MPGACLSHHAKLKKNYNLAMCHCTVRKSERIFHLLSLFSFLLFILPLSIETPFQFWRTDNRLVTGHISQFPLLYDKTLSWTWSQWKHFKIPRDPCAIMSPLRTFCYGSSLLDRKSYVVDEKASLRIWAFWLWRNRE